MKKRILSFIFSTLLVFCSLSVSALAAENPTATLSVGVSASGSVPASPEDYTFELKAADPANPMPEGSDSGVCTLIAKGQGTFAFPVVSYTRVGLYRYTVRQIPGTNALCTYDNTVYNVCVTVINVSGGELEAYVTVRESESDIKPTDMSFEVSYKPSGDDPGQPQTGDPTSMDLWVVLMALSLFGILLVSFGKKKDAA